jgi:Domain of unknown function (DUF4440)
MVSSLALAQGKTKVQWKCDKASGPAEHPLGDKPEHARCKSSVVDRNVIPNNFERNLNMTTKGTAFVVIVALSCITLSVNLHAQGDTAQQIKELQQQSRDAQMKNDASWAQQHLADGFVAGNSWGDWQTKDDFIKDLQSKTDKWKSGDISDVQVATFGPNIAVSHYTFTYDAEIRGTHRARTVICSDTWINDSGTWKTATTHCSMVKGK